MIRRQHESRAGARSSPPARACVGARVVRPARAEPEEMQAAIRAFTGEAQVQRGKVKLDIPPLVENGNSVP